MNSKQRRRAARDVKRLTRKHRAPRAPRCACPVCQMERDVLAAGGSVEADGTYTVDADWFRANFQPVED